MSFDLKIINGDLSISKSGNLNVVSTNNKIKQDILKILLTGQGENKFHPSYGSLVGNLELGGITDAIYVSRNIEKSVADAINKLITLQRYQARYQYISPSETIVSVKSVEAYRDKADPRMWSVFASVITQELNEVSESLTIRI